MQFRMGLGLSRRGATGGDPIAAFLADTKGGAWDFTNASTMFEDTSGLDPAETSDALALAKASYVGTVTPLDWSQSSVGSRPLWGGSYIELDGTDDRMAGSADISQIFANVGQSMIGIRFRATAAAISGARRAVSVSGTTGGINMGIRLIAGGAARVEGRRDDTDSATAIATVDTAAGLVAADTYVTLLATVDWATGGAGASNLYINGTLRATATGPAGGLTVTGASAASRIGDYTLDTTSMGGRVSRLIIANKIPTADERAAIEAWLTI